MHRPCRRPRAPRGAGLIEVHLAPAADASLRALLDDHASLSHTDGLAAVATCADAVVGVDVERVRPVSRMDGVARRVLGDEAARALCGIEDEAARLQGFFEAWTRAEARGKALRVGLLAPRAERDAVWCVALEGLPEGYVGAVACLGGPRRVVLARPSRPDRC